MIFSRNLLKILILIGIFFCLAVPAAAGESHPARDDLYLIVRKDHKPIIPLPEWGEIIHYTNNSALIRAEQTPQVSENPAEYHILRVTGKKKQFFRDETETDTAFLNYDNTVLNTPEISALTGSLQASGIYDLISHLEEYQTRFFLHPNRYQITSWIADELFSYGFTSVTIDSFFVDEYNWGNFPPVWQSNVIGMIEGSTYPDHYIMIGAHYDSIISSHHGDPMISAPGADDNASGTAAMLEIAKRLMENDYQPKKSLIFTAFGAEEVGLKGSRYYSRKLRDEGYNIELMLNNDMIAYTPLESDEWKLKLFPYGGFSYLAGLAENILDDHTLIEPVVSFFNNPSSDSFPFYEQGFPTLFLHEYYFNPYYHSPEDLLINLNTEYALEVTKASLLMMLYFDNIPVKVEDVSFVNAGNGRDIIVGWSYPVSGEIDHYNLYFGTEPGEYTEVFSSSETEFSLSGLEEGNEYFIGISAVDWNGHEGVITENPVIPSSIPAQPESFAVSSFRDHAVLSWRPNSELDLSGYNIYRSVDPFSSDPDLYVTNHPDTFFVDHDLNDLQYYSYAVTALDDKGNESIPAEEIITRLFSLCQGILLLNSTVEGNGTFLMPEKSSLFRYYDFLLSDFRFSYLSGQDVTDLSSLDTAPYSTIMLINDSILEPLKIPGFTAIMSKYLDKGGNLLLAGFNPLYQFTGEMHYPQEFEPDSFVHQYLGIDSSFLHTGSFFRSASPLLPEYPYISTDSQKTIQAVDHHIFSVAGLTNTETAESVYSYSSGFSSDTPAGAMHGAVVGVEHINPQSVAVTLTFPFYYMEEGDISSLLDHIFFEVFEEQKWELEAETGHKKAVYLLPNYPNPFRQETVIPFYLEKEGEVTIEVFNIKGQKVNTFFSGAGYSGRNKITWNGKDDNDRTVPSALYLLRVTQGKNSSTGKVLFLR